MLTSLLGLTACMKITPKITELRMLGGFTLDQQSIVVANKISPVVAVSGTCNPQFTDIEISLDKGGSWLSISQFATSSNFKCQSSGTFSYSLQFDHTVFAGSNAALLQLRGAAELGFSNPMLLSLGASSVYFNNLTSGGHQVPAVGTGYKLRGQIVGVANGALSSGGGFKLRGRLVTQ